MIAVIDKRKCASDSRICKPLQECPQKAISCIKDDNELLGSRMEINESKCTGCGICVDLCCGHCIILM